MGTRGPPPKPTALKKLEGNPGRYPLNAKEPEPRGPITKPDFVTGEAAKEWDRAIEAMPPGFYTAADVPTLTVVCLAWVIYRNALANVAAKGLIAVGSTGQNVQNPAVAIVSKQAEIILRASDRLGMSPSARARLEVQDNAPASKFDGLIPGGAALRIVK